MAMHLLRLAGIVFLTLEIGAAQTETEPQQDPLALLRPLEGYWEGAIDGKLGTGVGVRTYELILEEQFLMWRHESVREPQEKSPKGDYHRELGVFSYDSERKKIVLREFFVEGVVTRSVCDTEDARLVCVAERVESGPGIRSRLTLRIHDPYSFDEIFELAFPGDEELEIYFTNRWTRRPLLR